MHTLRAVRAARCHARTLALLGLAVATLRAAAALASAARYTATVAAARANRASRRAAVQAAAVLGQRFDPQSFLDETVVRATIDEVVTLLFEPDNSVFPGGARAPSKSGFVPATYQAVTT